MRPWQIRTDPIGALDDWPDLAEQFDARWVDHVKEDETFGQQLKRAQDLATEILEHAGVLKPRRPH